VRNNVEILQSARQVIEQAIREELRAQGHYLTGSLERSLTADFTLGNTTIMQGEALFYGQILNDGVSPARIPFSGSTGNGGTSAYIEGLKRYFMLKGLSDQEALRAAFATAHVHKREGMPSQGSSQYSSNGRRLKAIETAWNDSSRRVDRVLDNAYQREIDKTFMQTKSETI
jgi:hypothetical protein